MVGLKILLAEIGMVLGYIFGELDGLFSVLIIAILLDYLTGVIKAIIKKQLSSEIGYKGILKKISLFIVVALANIIDKIVFTNALFLRYGIMLLFLANEGISILENLSLIGVPIPQSIIKALLQVKNLSKTKVSDSKEIEDAKEGLKQEEGEDN